MTTTTDTATTTVHPCPHCHRDTTQHKTRDGDMYCHGCGERLPAPVEEDDGLTDLELAILASERKWWKHAGAREGYIRETFDMSPTRYAQIKNALIDKPEALAVDPQLVRRLLRLRDVRRRQRSAGRARE